MDATVTDMFIWLWMLQLQWWTVNRQELAESCCRLWKMLK